MKRLMAAFVVLVASCGSPEKQSPAVTRARQTDNIYEALFRHQMQPYGPPLIIFLEINGANPSDKFMARFADDTQSVKKRSAAKSAGPGGTVVDTMTGAAGVRLSAGPITWLDDVKVQVEGGYVRAGKHGRGGDFVLELRDGEWIVTGETPTWES